MVEFIEVSTDEWLLMSQHLVTLGRLSSCGNINLHFSRNKGAKFDDNGETYYFSDLSVIFELPDKDFLISWCYEINGDTEEVVREGFNVIKMDPDLGMSSSLEWTVLVRGLGTVEEAWEIAKTRFEDDK